MSARSRMAERIALEALGAALAGALLLLAVHAAHRVKAPPAPSELFCLGHGPPVVQSAGVGFVVRCP